MVRMEKLASLIEPRIGTATSLIYKEALKHLAQKQLYCRVDFEMDHQAAAGHEEDDDLVETTASVTVNEIASTFELPAGVSASIGIVPSHQISRRPHVPPSRARKKSAVFAEDEMEIGGDASSDEDENDANLDEKPDVAELNGQASDENDDKMNLDSPNGINGGKAKSNDDQPRDDGKSLNNGHDPANSTLSKKVIRDHLLLLMEDPGRLIQRRGGERIGFERWKIRFDDACNLLRMATLERIIKDRYGLAGLRIMSLLVEKGKLEEKHLSAFILVNQKSMRVLLAEMLANGHLELQEVPRDAVRAPGKTMFFWYFDPRRCTTKVLEEVYKAMARCMQRVKIEKEKYQSVIEKSQRSDVLGNEETMLTGKERKALSRWQETEEALRGQIDRLDDVVFCLRDF